MLDIILLIGSLLGFLYSIIFLFSFMKGLKEINIKEKEVLSKIKLELQNRKIKTYILSFIILFIFTFYFFSKHKRNFLKAQILYKNS